MKRFLILNLITTPVLALSLPSTVQIPLPSVSITPPVSDTKEKTPASQPPSLTPQMRMIAKEYFSLATTCVEEEKYEKAINYFQEVIKRTPENSEALSQLGELSQQLHRYNHAIEYYKKVIELEPTNPEAHTHLGICYFHTQKLTDAKTHLKQSVSLQPKNIHAFLFLGMIAEKEKQYEQALSYYEKSALQQESFDVHYHLGTTHAHLGKWQDSITHYEKALEFDPHHNGTLIALANTYNVCGNHTKAIDLYEKVLVNDPHNTTARYNYGFTLKQQGKFDEAISVYKQVLLEQPDYALAHFSLALTYLTLENFAEGLVEYEWRTKLYREPLPEMKVPRWEGQSLSHKTILLVAEQGFGDTLQFVRYTQQLKKNGAHIILMAQEPLVALLSLCSSLDTVISLTDSPPVSDYWLPLMSLPLQCKTTATTIPATIPYIKSPPHITAYWKSYLTEDPHFKVGICWQGNDLYHTQPLKYAVQRKSIPLKTLMTLSTISGISLYSLQQQLGLEQIAELPYPHVLHTFDSSFDVTHGRFMDTAAVISNLDLIISVDTAIAHLAGALAKPVWLLVPTPCDWRWMTNRTDSPWYPTMRIFRQKNAGDWDSVIAEISKELERIKYE